MGFWQWLYDSLKQTLIHTYDTLKLSLGLILILISFVILLFLPISLYYLDFTTYSFYIITILMITFIFGILHMVYEINKDC